MFPGEQMPGWVLSELAGAGWLVAPSQGRKGSPGTKNPLQMSAEIHAPLHLSSLGMTSITQSIWETSPLAHQMCDLSALGVTLTQMINCSKSKQIHLLEMVE